MRPGLSDLATLAYVDEETTLAAFTDPEACYRNVILPRKLDLNLGYLQLRTRWTDLALIFLTLRFVLRPGVRDQHWMRRFLPAEGIPAASGSAR